MLMRSSASASASASNDEASVGMISEDETEERIFPLVGCSRDCWASLLRLSLRSEFIWGWRPGGLFKDDDEDNDILIVMMTYSISVYCTLSTGRTVVTVLYEFIAYSYRR